MTNFKNLMGSNRHANIVCLYKGTVVRRLSVVGDSIEIDAITETVKVPLDTEITYEPWFMDRGSLLFALPSGRVGKLCTEGDMVYFGDGTERHLDAPR